MPFTLEQNQDDPQKQIQELPCLSAIHCAQAPPDLLSYSLASFLLRFSHLISRSFHSEQAEESAKAEPCCLDHMASLDSENAFDLMGYQLELYSTYPP